MDELIKKRRKELGITLEEIGDYVGVSKTTVQRWENGNISNMRRDRIKKLSEILQIDVQHLLDIEKPHKDCFVKIPLLDRIVPGVPMSAQNDVVGYVDVPEKWLEAGNIFAIKIKDDSMKPRFEQGDIVIAVEQKMVNSGEYAVVVVGDKTMCKKVIRHYDRLVFASTNPRYEPMLFDLEDIKEKYVVIAGKAIELRAKL